MGKRKNSLEAATRDTPLFVLLPRRGFIGSKTDEAVFLEMEPKMLKHPPPLLVIQGGEEHGLRHYRLTGRFHAWRVYKETIAC